MCFHQMLLYRHEVDLSYFTRPVYMCIIDCVDSLHFNNAFPSTAIFISIVTIKFMQYYGLKYTCDVCLLLKQ